MRVAIVHDYLTQRGGAERVVLAMTRALPGSPVLTSVYAPNRTFEEFADVEVIPTALQRLPFARRDPRLLLPFLPRAFRTMDLTAYDAVLCSSSGFSHLVSPPPGVPKIVYCHNPPRWLHQPSDYFTGRTRVARHILQPFAGRMARRDRSGALSAAEYFANSTAVLCRLHAVYGLEATLLHPPIGLNLDGVAQPVDGVEPGYLLVVARARGYKHLDQLEALLMDHPGERLIVVGSKGLSTNPQVNRLGRVTDGALRWLYGNAKALIAPAHEDFGLTPVEAQVFGTPVLALRAGGYLDTVNDGVNGVFFERLSPSAFATGLRDINERRWDRQQIAATTARFSEASFGARLRAAVFATPCNRVSRKGAS